MTTAVARQSITYQRIRLRVDVLCDLARDVRAAGHADLASSIERVARDIGNQIERLSSST